MTESLLHDAFHAVLPTLAEHLDYLLTGTVAAVLVWLRARLQVRAIAATADEVTYEAQQEAATGPAPAEDLQEWRTAKRAREKMHVLLRPREARLKKLVKAARKKPPKS